MCYVYKIINLITGKIYIGFTKRTIELRFKEHIRDSNKLDWPLYQAMRKYGVDNFTIEEIYKTSDKNQALIMEEFFVKEFNTLVPNGMNLLPGGENRKHHQITKKKMSNRTPWNRGIKMSQDFRDKCSKRVVSEETKIKRSIITKARLSKNGHHFLGKKLSQEHIENLRKSHLGQVSTQRVPIICINNGIVYESQTAAAKALNICSNHISQVCKNKRPHTYGYVFRYFSKPEDK